MKPYTYLIKHRPSGKVYYGFRCANRVEPHEDLWKHYFTSSPKIQQLIEATGADSFDTEIRRVFETKEQAVSWETRVLHRCKVLQDNRWLNQNVAGYIIPTEESNKKISDFHKDKPKSKEHKEKIKSYIDSHKEEIQEYRDNHKDKTKVYNAEYRSVNSEKIAKDKSKYNADHAEEISIRRHKKYTENAEEVKRKATEYRNKNREEINKRQKEARVKKKLIPLNVGDSQPL
jgi:hypothetical protein